MNSEEDDDLSNIEKREVESRGGIINRVNRIV